MKLHVYPALAGLLLVSLAAGACNAAPKNMAAGPTATPKPAAVDVATVKRADMESSLSYSGSVKASTEVNVVPKISARITKLNVDVGSAVKAGQVIAQLDTSTLDAQVAQAQDALDSAKIKLAEVQAGPRAGNVESAKANLAAAEAKLAGLKAGPREQSVAQAKANLDAAKAKLAQLKEGPTDAQIKQAQLAISQAKNSLYAAQVKKDGDCNPHNPDYLCKASQASTDAAQTAVEQAEQQLAILKAPPSKAALAQAQAAIDAAQQQYELAQTPYTAQDIAQAQAAVNAAQAQLNLAEQPYTDNDLKLAQVAVNQAKDGLDLAKLQLADAKVTAPIDGIVSQKLLDQGAMASPSTPIVTIISKNVEIDINVEESKLGLVAAGQKATVRVPAYPDAAFAASVVGAPPTVDPKSRTALVQLAAVDPKGQLKPGMYATVAVTVAPQKNVLVVPITALVNDNGQTEVYLVQKDNTIKVQPVTVGVQDQQNAEITKGLSEGQMVVVGNKPSLIDGQRVSPTTAGR